MFIATSTNKTKINWLLYLIVFILLLQLSSVVSMVVNDPIEVDALIKAQISLETKIDNPGNLQRIQTSNIGPITFYKMIYFQQAEYQVSAKAIQFLGLKPIITCASSSVKRVCQ